MSLTSLSGQIALAPTRLQPYGLPTYNTVADAITDYQGDDQIYVLYPRKIEQAARTFMSGFPGSVLYALKANPHPSVIQILWDEGVRNFDVASIREIDLLRELLPDANLFLMHPVKSRATITHAYNSGIRDFAFDHADELAKILECTGHADDLTLHLRLALPAMDTKMPLEGKFGAGFDDAVHLLKKARCVAAKLGLCFHVGSQCLIVENYDAALKYTRALVDTAGVTIETLDVGGGFPVAYVDMPTVPMDTYFDAIRNSLNENGFDTLDIMGEPGRALCAEGGSTLARVELRKGNDLHLNDGTYGSLFDAGQFAWKFPVALSRPFNTLTSPKTTPFRFFGPTCDATDLMTGPFHLPDDTREGDWIEIKHLGAYGQTLATQFNGFFSMHTVAVLANT